MIKRLLRKLAEKLTDRKCSSCRYNCGGCCAHPSDGMFMRCWHSITLPGYKKKPPKYLRYEHTTPTLGRATVTETGEGVAAKVEALTPEQEYQLEKIKATLRDAEDIARDSGLLTED